MEGKAGVLRKVTGQLANVQYQGRKRRPEDEGRK
jgi:hypothetical protein